MMMFGFAVADETIIADIQPVVHIFEISGHFIRKLCRLNAAIARCLGHFKAMLIRAGLEKYVPAHHPLETGDRVGSDHLISMADMRAAVGIADSGCDGVRLLRHAPSLASVPGCGKPADRKSTRLNSSDSCASRLLSSACTKK